MAYKGVLYKHIHPRLISKELFDECQAVRKGRKPTKYKKTQKPFILKGLLKCKHCDCSYSPEIKKGKYVYMRPTKSQGDCSYCYHINENKILSQIEEVLKKLTIPQNILLQLNEELKSSSNAEHKNQMQEIAKLKTQYTSVQTKIKTARDFLLDFTITKVEFDEIKTDLEVQKANIEHKIQVLSRADSEFNKSLGTIFELLSKAHQLFKSSEIEEKRRNLKVRKLKKRGELSQLCFRTYY